MNVAISENPTEPLELALSEYNVSPELKGKIVRELAYFWNEFEKYADYAMTIQVTDESQTDLIREAKNLADIFARIRIDSGLTKDLLKKDALEYGKAVQSVYNLIVNNCKPIEEHLKEQKDFLKIRQERIKKEIERERLLLLAPYSKFVIANQNFADMPKQEFELILAEAKRLFEKAQEAEEKKELHQVRKEEVLDFWFLLEKHEKESDFSDFSPNDWQQKLNEWKERKAEKDKEAELERQKSKIQEQRTKMLLPYFTFVPQNLNLREMSEAGFQEVLEQAKQRYEQEKEVERKEKEAQQ